MRQILFFSGISILFTFLMGCLAHQIRPDELNRQVAGGMNSGGGHIVLTKNGDFVLLDLFLKDPSLQFQKESRNGIVLPESKSFKNLGVDYLKDADPLSRAIYNLIEKWNTSSPQFTFLLKHAMKSTQFYYVNEALNFKDSEFFIPPDFNDSNIKIETVAAIYSQWYGVFLSKTSFDQLNDINQRAVIVHELLRHLQIGYRIHITNEDLQKITAAIVLDDSDGISLDNYLKNSFSTDEKSMAKELSLAICAAAEKYIFVSQDCKSAQESVSTFEILTIGSRAAHTLATASTKAQLDPDERTKLRSEAEKINSLSAEMLVARTNTDFNSTSELRKVVDTMYKHQSDVIRNSLDHGSPKAIENIRRIFNDLSAKK